jgi:hypothetical protein
MHMVGLLRGSPILIVGQAVAHGRKQDFPPDPVSGQGGCSPLGKLNGVLCSVIFNRACSQARFFSFYSMFYRNFCTIL